MEPESKFIMRSSKPNSYDHAQKGTICKVSQPFAPTWDIYRQTSLDSNLPHWEFIGVVEKDSVIPPTF